MSASSWFIAAAFVLSYGFIVWLEFRLEGVRKERDAAIARAEEAEKMRFAIVQAVEKKAAEKPAPARPQEPRRVARTYGEWNRAAEMNALPMGMREKKNAPNV